MPGLVKRLGNSPTPRDPFPTEKPDCALRSYELGSSSRKKLLKAVKHVEDSKSEYRDKIKSVCLVKGSERNKLDMNRNLKTVLEARDSKKVSILLDTEEEEKARVGLLLTPKELIETKKPREGTLPKEINEFVHRLRKIYGCRKSPAHYV